MGAIAERCSVKAIWFAQAGMCIASSTKHGHYPNQAGTTCSMGRACSALDAVCHMLPAARPLATASRVRASRRSLSTPTPCCLSHAAPVLPNSKTGAHQPSIDACFTGGKGLP